MPLGRGVSKMIKHISKQLGYPWRRPWDILRHFNLGLGNPERFSQVRKPAMYQAKSITGRRLWAAE